MQLLVPASFSSRLRPRGTGLAFVALAFVSACSAGPASVPSPAPSATPETAALPAEDDAANRFITQTERELRDLWVARDLKTWAMSTDITDETQRAAAEASEKVMGYLAATMPEIRRFDGAKTDESTRRRLDLLRLSTSLPAPKDPALRAELAALAADLEGMYGKGKSCKKVRGKETCRDLGDLSEVLAKKGASYEDQLAAWTDWHTISVPMRPKYARMVELANIGARELGYADLGEYWRSNYDMPAPAFEAEIERLWGEVRPLYESLHCYVRARLAQKYGKKKVDEKGPIGAHLLGNMWAQEWANIYPLVEPYRGESSVDLTKALVDKGYDAKKMVTSAEDFFVSLGMDRLPTSFWERSMFEKPKGREVVCHASAWDVTYNDDLRIKMCIKPTADDFVTIHHELGHLYYFHAYYKLPLLFQAGANDGFHEGIGDTIALSITPSYLESKGLIAKTSTNEKAIINLQLQAALERVAFLPFGLLMDKWRWGVFSGQIPTDRYNSAWWELRTKYQGLSAPVSRSETDFDPGAKFHIPGNTPYARYFLARILQFQFHKALCATAGHTGPLHECSIYGSRAAGEKLHKMLAMGASRPWPDALEAVTGTRQIDAGALLEYFAPLQTWLAKENAGRTCGW